MVFAFANAKQRNNYFGKLKNTVDERGIRWNVLKGLVAPDFEGPPLVVRNADGTVSTFRKW